MGLKDRFTKGAPAPEGYEPPPSPDSTDESEDIGEGLTGEIRELARRKLRHTLGVRRELKALHEVLAEGETVLNLAAGGYDGHQGLLVVTERRLFFYEKGMVRSRQEDFPYSKVSSIQTETKMTSGSLVIFVSGNKAVINQVFPKERVNEIGEYVRGRISDGATARRVSRRLSGGASRAPAGSSVDARPGADHRRRVRGEA